MHEQRIHYGTVLIEEIEGDEEKDSLWNVKN